MNSKHMTSATLQKYLTQLYYKDMFFISVYILDIRISHSKSMFFLRSQIENRTNLSFNVYFHKKAYFSQENIKQAKKQTQKPCIHK